MAKIILAGAIEIKIFQIRGKKVMLDRDLAALYGVETRALNQAVKRNMMRFPDDFMFSLTRAEINRMSQSVISLKFYKSVAAFTEHGVAMLSSVLHSEKAILVNIQIMRAFVSLRRIAVTYAELRRKIEDVERKYDGQFSIVFQALRGLIEPPREKPRRITGFSKE